MYVNLTCQKPQSNIVITVNVIENKSLNNFNQEWKRLIIQSIMWHLKQMSSTCHITNHNQLLSILINRIVAMEFGIMFA